MVCVGNHESGSNYSQYINRFNMPNTEDNIIEEEKGREKREGVEHYFDETKICGLVGISQTFTLLLILLKCILFNS